MVKCWTIQGASHLDAGKLCQDASLSMKFRDMEIIAVSDGHGGKKYTNSDKGAKYAVCTVCNALIHVAFSREFNHMNTAMRSHLAKYIVANWNEGVAKDIAISGRDDSPESYGATLIAYLQTDKFWMALQIGDGRCVMLSKKGKWQQPVPWDDRCFLNETTSLCDDNAALEFRFASGDINNLPKAVFLCSDGLDGTFGDGKFLYNFYNHILESLKSDGEEAVSTKMEEALSHYSGVGSKDDISLAMIVND